MQGLGGVVQGNGAKLGGLARFPTGGGVVMLTIVAFPCVVVTVLQVLTKTEQHFHGRRFLVRMFQWCI